jgi:trigger factor
MSAGQSTTFTTTLVGGDFAGREAEVAVTVRTVKEREMPPVDDDFAQLASEFDTLTELRADLTERVARAKRVEQLYAARDKALAAMVAASDVPAPEGVVKDEVNSRKQAMVDQLERMGASLEDYLESESKTEEDLDTEIGSAAQEGVRIQLLLDAFADQDEIQVTDDEYGHEIVHRANRAGVAPQQYYDQLTRAGMAGAVYGDVRRGKALAALLGRVSIKDSSGAPVPLDALQGDGEDHTGHDHD